MAAISSLVYYNRNGFLKVKDYKTRIRPGLFSKMENNIPRIKPFWNMQNATKFFFQNLRILSMRISIYRRKEDWEKISYDYKKEISRIFIKNHKEKYIKIFIAYLLIILFIC